MRIYHIVPSEIWENFSGDSFEADSLATEGFIHCSFAEQIAGVLKRYYANAGEVTILEIDPTKLYAKLVTEPSTGGENYPHIYGQINTTAIVGTEKRQIS
jgi:uncharacterized protein (DUF952 family)